DLACHRDIRSYRDAGEHADHRGDDADAGARAVLRRRALRQMDVDVVLLVEIFLDPKPARARAHHRERRLDRLLHHLAELAGGDGLAFAGHGHGLDRMQLAPDLVPGEALDLSDLD